MILTNWIFLIIWIVLLSTWGLLSLSEYLFAYHACEYTKRGKCTSCDNLEMKSSYYKWEAGMDDEAKQARRLSSIVESTSSGEFSSALAHAGDYASNAMTKMSAAVQNVSPATHVSKVFSATFSGEHFSSSKDSSFAAGFGRMSGALHRALKEEVGKVVGMHQSMSTESQDLSVTVKNARDGARRELTAVMHKDSKLSAAEQKRRMSEIEANFGRIFAADASAAAAEKRRLQQHSAQDTSTSYTGNENKDDRGWWLEPDAANGCIMGYGPHNKTSLILGGQAAMCKVAWDTLYDNSGLSFKGDHQNYWGYDSTSGSIIRQTCTHMTNDPDRNLEVDNNIHRIGMDIFWWGAEYQSGYFDEKSWTWAKPVKMWIPCHGGGVSFLGDLADYFVGWTSDTIFGSRISGSPPSDGYMWCQDTCDCLEGELIPDYTKRYWGIVFLVCVILSYLMACVNCAMFVKFYGKSSDCEEDWADVKRWRMIHMPVMAGVIPGVGVNDIQMQQQLMQQQQMLMLQQQQQTHMHVMNGHMAQQGMQPGYTAQGMSMHQKPGSVRYGGGASGESARRY